MVEMLSPGGVSSGRRDRGREGGRFLAEIIGVVVPGASQSTAQEASELASPHMLKRGRG